MNRELSDTKNNDGENTPSFLLPPISATASQDNSKNSVQLMGSSVYEILARIDKRKKEERRKFYT